MTAYQTWIEGDEAPWETENDNKESAGQIWTFAERKGAHTGLTVGYGGGAFDEQTVADGTVAGLTDNATNYLVVNRSTLAVTSATSTTNWDDTMTYGRMARAVFASGVLTWNDERWSPGGIYRAEGSGAGSVSSVNGQTGAVTLDSFDIEHPDALSQFGSPSTIGNALEELAVGTKGKHAIYIAAGAISPSATGGCAVLATIASAANQPDISTLDFDAATQEYAQFGIVMPKSWNEGTITFKAHWSHASTTTNFGVAWSLQAVAVSDDDAIAVAFGTAQTVTDTGGTTNDFYSTAESSAITVSGSPAAEDMVFFRVSRETGNGSDTMAIDARLHGITIYITTNAENDA